MPIRRRPKNTGIKQSQAARRRVIRTPRRARILSRTPCRARGRSTTARRAPGGLHGFNHTATGGMKLLGRPNRRAGGREYRRVPASLQRGHRAARAAARAGSQCRNQRHEARAGAGRPGRRAAAREPFSPIHRTRCMQDAAPGGRSRAAGAGGAPSVVSWNSLRSDRRRRSAGAGLGSASRIGPHRLSSFNEAGLTRQLIQMGAAHASRPSQQIWRQRQACTGARHGAGPRTAPHMCRPRPARPRTRAQRGRAARRAPSIARLPPGHPYHPVDHIQVVVGVVRKGLVRPVARRGAAGADPAHFRPHIARLVPKVGSLPPGPAVRRPAWAGWLAVPGGPCGAGARRRGWRPFLCGGAALCSPRALPVIRRPFRIA